MDKPLIMVSSFTSAMRGMEILRKKGFECELFRTFNNQDGGGCGYSVYVKNDSDMAEIVLKESGIRVIGRSERRQRK